MCYRVYFIMLVTIFRHGDFSIRFSVYIKHVKKTDKIIGISTDQFSSFDTFIFPCLLDPDWLHFHFRLPLWLWWLSAPQLRWQQTLPLLNQQGLTIHWSNKTVLKKQFFSWCFPAILIMNWDVETIFLKWTKFRQMWENVHVSSCYFANWFEIHTMNLP